MDQAIVDAMRNIVNLAKEEGADKAFIARAMARPPRGISRWSSPPIRRIHAARDFVVKTLAKELKEELLWTMRDNTSEKYERDGESARRGPSRTRASRSSHLRTRRLTPRRLQVQDSGR